MRQATLFLAILAGIASAQTLNHTAFAGTGSIALSNFSHNGESAQALVANGEVVALFLTSNGTLALSTDEVLLADALRSFYISRGYSLSSLSSLSSVHGGIAAIRGNRLSGEERCRVLIGTDRNPCTDFLSCQQACYSVTSFCLPVALGSGRVFVNEVWLFENRSNELSAAYSEEEAAYLRLSSNSTRESLERYMASLSGINRAATAAAKSALYDAYSYCALPDYSLTQITSLQLDARKIQQNASKLFYLQEEAALVRSRTLAGLERLALLNQSWEQREGGLENAASNTNPSQDEGAQQGEGNSSEAGGKSGGIAQGASPESSQAEGPAPLSQLSDPPSSPDNSRRSVVFLAVAFVIISTAVLALTAGSRQKQRARNGKS